MDTIEAQQLVESEVKHQAKTDLAANLHQSLSADLQRIMALSSEKGVLSVLHVNDHSFAFWDALCLCYE